MEFMYQYVGSGKHSAPLCVYASPSENKFEKCGELRRGAYFASSKTLYLSSQIWLQIRQGTFSNHKKNGYIPVSLAHDFDPSNTTPPIICFRNLLKMPSFPVFLHTLQPLRISRIPMFVTGQSPEPHTRVPHRVLQPHTVIEATQCQWNDNHTQIALQIKSFHGTTGWTVIPFGTLFEEAFAIIGSPVHYSCRTNVVGSRYVQNIASRSGRNWKGGLPYRAVPMLQAPRVGVLGPFQVVKLLERKIVKDQVWLEVEIQCEADQIQNTSDEPVKQENLSIIPLEDQNENSGSTKAVWIVERNVNTGEQVVIPWGVGGGFTELLSQDTSRDLDAIERYYRNVYAEKSLSINSEARIDGEVIGQLEPGTVFASNYRVLNRDGQIWIRLAMTITVKQENLSIIPLEDQNENSGSTKAVWIVERNVNTGEQVVIPWGVGGGFTELLSQDTSRDLDAIERYYRNVYAEKSLSINSEARIDGEVIGQLEPGTVFASNYRVLNRDGQIWIRLAMTITGDTQNEEYGFVIQSDPTDNNCLLQEIRRPGKIEPKESLQICCKPETSADAKKLISDEKSLGVTVYSEASTASKELCKVKNGAIFPAIGSIYNQKSRSIWYQVLVEDIIKETISIDGVGGGSTSELARQLKQLDQLVVYLPACELEYQTPWRTDVYLLGPSIQIEQVDQNMELSYMTGSKWKESASRARIVFSARASKLFGLHPASLPTANKESDGTSLSSTDGASFNNSGTSSEGHKMIRMESTQSICASLQNYIINWKHWLQPVTNCFGHSGQRDDGKYRSIDAATNDSEDEEREAQGMYACSA
ncbi:hypothetical protein ABG067_000749 [Albugo candida]